MILSGAPLSSAPLSGVLGFSASARVIVFGTPTLTPYVSLGDATLDPHLSLGEPTLEPHITIEDPTLEPT